MQTTASDDALLASLGRDPEALAEFYRRHVGRVVGFAARRCTRPADVADVVAETFVELIGSSTRFDPRRGSADAWLFGIAAHVAAAHARRERRQRAVARRVAGHTLLDGDDHERLAARIDAERLAPELSRALARLRPRDRELVQLVDVDGLTAPDAAAALGIRAPAARMRLTRARRRLRATLEAEPLPLGKEQRA
jgi:RNA polymerase sigma factor (sigma-70 family)